MRFHRTGTKRLHHPIVGDLALTYEALELPGDTGQRVNVYTSEPGTPSADALNLLASWATAPADRHRGPREHGAVMDVARAGATWKGPAEWFTGDVFIDRSRRARDRCR